MKKRMLAAMAALAAALAAGCGGNGAEDAAGKFAKAVCTGDFETAARLSDDALARSLKKIKPEKRPAGKGVKCSAGTPLARAGRKTVPVDVSADGGWTRRVELSLVEADGSWIVENDPAALKQLLSVPSGGGSDEEEED